MTQSWSQWNTKLVHFIPTNEVIDSNDTTTLYLHNIWKHHRTLEEIISNRGLVFVPKFTKRLYELLCIKPSPTTTFHPQSDNQTERINQILEQYLHIFMARRQDDWSDLLSIAEFAYNNSLHSAIGYSPFFAIYGYNLALSITMPTTTTVLAAKQRIHQLQEIH